MCGIIGVIRSLSERERTLENKEDSESAREAFLGLLTLQHRGQDGAGILTYGPKGFRQVKGIGLAESIFTKEQMVELSGPLAIGHTRYSTTGRGALHEVQPFLVSYPFGIGLVHNGNIVNFTSLAEEMVRESRFSVLSGSDSEVLLNLLAEGLIDGLEAERKKSVKDATPKRLSRDLIQRALEHLYKKANGSFSVVAAIAGNGMLAFRDPYGIRPLVLGERVDADGVKSRMVASETVALYFNGYEVVRSLEPGECLWIDESGEMQSLTIGKATPRPCMFEWIYFASAESEIGGLPVYGARIELGKMLAPIVRERLKKLGADIDVVAAVPDTSRTAATALAEELGVSYREVLIKNRYIKRTFILSGEDKRQKAVNLKLSPVRSELVGKRVLLVDDSIVRGTTSKKIVELVRKAGAKEVYFVSACPPIRHPCYYGIDFPSGDELLAFGRDSEQIEREIGADAVIYMTHDGLLASLRNNQPGLTPCLACLDGNYPTDVSEGKRFAEKRTRDRAHEKLQGVSG